MRRPKRCPQAARPLAGIEVLDLTRIIAGPVCGRTLAVHGADVLLVGASHLPSVAAARHRHRPRKIVGLFDLREARGRERSRPWPGTPTFSCRATGRAPSPRWASALRRSQRSGPASSLCRCALTATTDPGRHVAATIRWCRPQAASTPRKRRLSAPASRSRCPLQALDHATGYLMAFASHGSSYHRAEQGSFVACARLAGADRPLGCAGLGALTAWPAPIRSLTTCATAWRRRRPDSAASPRCVTLPSWTETPPHWARPQCSARHSSPRRGRLNRPTGSSIQRDLANRRANVCASRGQRADT